MNKAMQAIKRAQKHGWKLIRWGYGTTAVMGRGMRHSQYLITIDPYGNVSNGY